MKVFGIALFRVGAPQRDRRTRARESSGLYATQVDWYPSDNKRMVGVNHMEEKHPPHCTGEIGLNNVQIYLHDLMILLVIINDCTTTLLC